MISSWTKNLQTPEEKKKFEDKVIGAKLVLDRLTEILEELKTGLDNVEMTAEAYDTPNWSEKQAHRNGFRSCLKTVLKIINLDQQEKKTHGRQPIRRQ